MKTKLLRRLRRKFLKNYTIGMFGKNITVRYRGTKLATFPFETNIEKINDFLREQVRDDIERYCLHIRCKNELKTLNKASYLW